jgi:transcription initiation factor TFIID TATA-box-binding protein
MAKKAKKAKKKGKAKRKPSKKAKKAVKKSKPAKKKVSKAKETKSTARDIKVVNIVVSTSLEHDIPLEKMAATLSNTEYNPEQFPGLVIRIKEPKTSALVFSSGKVVCTGARTLHDVRESIKKIIKSLEKINVKITIEPKIIVQNIVASGSVGMDLNLNTLAMKLDNTEYEPEQFPGLVYKLPEVGATFLLFSNGKVVCTGTKSEEAVHKALDKLIENLKKIKKK